MSVARVDSRTRRRSLLLLALLAAALVMVGAGSLIAYSWSAVNRLEAQRETLLVERALQSALSRVTEEARSDAAWDDAYARTSDSLDQPWLLDDFASYFRAVFRHDLTLVFDRRGALGFAASHGRQIDPAQLKALERSLEPLVRRVQAQELRLRARRGPDADDPETDTQGSDSVVVRSGPDVFLLGASTLSPSNGFARGPRPAAVVVTGRRLDSRFLATLKQDLGITGAGLADAAPKGTAFIPARGLDGKPVAFVVWRFDRPGLSVLAQAGGWIGTALALIALTAIALALRIRRMLARLEANDRALGSTLAELKLAGAEAQAANLAKSQFLANMSHEIRTPLNGVLGMAQALERDSLTPSQRDRVSTIRRSGKALLAILNDVIDLSRIEAGKLDISITAFDMADVIESVLDTYRDVASAKDVELGCDISASARDVFLGDPLRVRQILLNLVSNAVKFTDEGRVRVEVSATADGVVIKVADQGVGIAEQDLMHLFEKFSQVDGAADRRFAGAGLGLAICRELTELMGGRITVESEAGKGSTFTLALPLERARGGGAPTALTPGENPAKAFRPDRPLRILAAEDNETNRRVLEVLLEPLGAEVVLANDGAQAVEAFRSQSFDVVLMDVQMPVMNGVAATRMIREIERREGRASTPIVAISANVMVHQLEEYAAAGMDGHVGKPIEVERLYAALSAALEDVDAAPATGRSHA